MKAFMLLMGIFYVITWVAFGTEYNLVIGNIWLAGSIIKS